MIQIRIRLFLFVLLYLFAFFSCATLHNMYLTDKKPLLEIDVYQPLKTVVIASAQSFIKSKMAVSLVLGEMGFSIKKIIQDDNHYEAVTHFALNKIDLDSYNRGLIGSLSFYLIIKKEEYGIVLDIQYCIAYGGSREKEWREDCLCRPEVEPQVTSIADIMLDQIKSKL